MDLALLERESNRQFFSPLSVLSITNEKSYPVSSLVEEMMLVLQLYSDSFNIIYQWLLIYYPLINNPKIITSIICIVFIPIYPLKITPGNMKLVIEWLEHSLRSESFQPSSFYSPIIRAIMNNVLFNRRRKKLWLKIQVKMISFCY